tara:strand:- start:770 stop:1495 length:726 start_codon:yes stop_codon:yes gene_type:complete
MKKRAQVTVFIIVAIVIIAGIGLFFILKDKISFGGGISPEVMSIYSYVESCIKDELVESIELVGLQGGYINVPQQHLQAENLTPIAYGYNRGNNVLPTKNKIEAEISNYIKLHLSICLDSGSFSGFEIKKGEINVDTKIKENRVLVLVNYPLGISKGDSSYLLKEYSVESLSKLWEAHNIADEMVNQLVADPSNIDMTYLTNLDYDVIIVPYDDKTFIYSIHDLDDKGEIAYVFRFANRLK